MNRPTLPRWLRKLAPAAFLVVWVQPALPGFAVIGFSATRFLTSDSFGATLPFGDSAPPPARTATDYPAVDLHATEKVAVAADPFDRAERGPFLHVDYWKYNVLPVRVIVTNNSDRPIGLDQARIYFITASGDRIKAAEPEDIERMADKPKNPTNKPLPFPLPKGKPTNAKIEQDFNALSFRSLTVAPHSTESGFLFYDLADLRDPLRGAKLYVRSIRDADGAELFFFECPFDKYLATSH